VLAWTFLTHSTTKQSSNRHDCLSNFSFPRNNHAVCSESAAQEAKHSLLGTSSNHSKTQGANYYYLADLSPIADAVPGFNFLPESVQHTPTRIAELGLCKTKGMEYNLRPYLFQVQPLSPRLQLLVVLDPRILVDPA
jgi:hypothetical protein